MIDRELRITADLARIALSRQEHERFAQEVQSMLTYLDSMTAAEAALEDTAAGAADPNPANPTHYGPVQPLRRASGLRPDHPVVAARSADLVEAAEETEDRFIAVPNVL